MSEDATLFQLGVDVDLPEDETAEQFEVHCTRLAKIEGISKYTKLRKLVFVATGLQEIEGLDENNQLEHLEIYQASISIIKGIANLTKLKSLDLSFNKITKIECLSSLTQLEKLYLSSNEIKRIEGLDTLIDLKILELGSNEIRVIENIDKLEKLEELWLGKNKINKMQISRKFEKLRLLSLQSNRLKEWCNELFINAPSLQQIYMSNNYLTDIPDEVMKTIPPSVIELDLASNKLTKVPKFGALTQLKELWMNDNNIDDFESLDNLASCPNLETVYLERNKVQSLVPVEYIRKVKSVCKKLFQLDAVPVMSLRITEDHHDTIRSILKH